MNLFALGLNHNTAPLALREKVAFSSEELDTANQKIRAMLGNPAGGGIKEGVIEIQGDKRDLIKTELEKAGFSVKLVGG